MNIIKIPRNVREIFTHSYFVLNDRERESVRSTWKWWRFTWIFVIIFFIESIDWMFSWFLIPIDWFSIDFPSNSRNSWIYRSMTHSEQVGLILLLRTVGLIWQLVELDNIIVNLRDFNCFLINFNVEIGIIFKLPIDFSQFSQIKLDLLLFVVLSTNFP